MKHFYIFDLDGTLCDSMGYWNLETAHIPAEEYSNPLIAEPAYDKMREHYRRDVELKPGVIEFLEKARADGIRMCIASATRRDVSEPFLARSGLLEYMEFYIDCWEVGAYKERPDVYLRAAERLGASISDCIVFEDAEYCARTAQRAGFFVVGINDQNADATDGRFCNMFFDNWNELLAHT